MRIGGSGLDGVETRVLLFTDSRPFVEIGKCWRQAWLNASLRAKLLQHLIFECHVFGIVRLEPPVRGFGIGEGLDVIGMADVISGAT